MHVVMLAGMNMGIDQLLKIENLTYITSKGFKAVDDVIDSSAPGYKDYLQKYAAASKGIERLGEAQTFRSKVLSTTPDPINVGDFMISQPSFARDSY